MLSETPKRRNGRRVYWCRCACSRRIEVPSDELYRYGETHPGCVVCRARKFDETKAGRRSSVAEAMYSVNRAGTGFANMVESVIARLGLKSRGRLILAMTAELAVYHVWVRHGRGVRSARLTSDPVSWPEAERIAREHQTATRKRKAAGVATIADEREGEPDPLPTGG